MSALLGALLPLSFAPFHFYWLAFPVLAGLFYLWDGQTRREAAWRGFWFGFGVFVTGVYWLYISVHIFGGVPVWVALILMLGLIGLMAMYVALAGLLAAMLSHRSVVLRWCVLWPAIWTLFEWLRGVLFSGFPWLSLGYSQIDGPLRGWAPVGGVYSITSDKATGLVRAWSHQTAPPAASTSILLVPSDLTVRGQGLLTGLSPSQIGLGGLLVLGVTGTIIALSIDNDDAS